MDQPQNPKQQIVEKLKNANNVLITVSSSPTVDQLACAIGLALMLDKLDKHATAVYSGETPSVIEFLNPSGNLHKNTDSLQDFIISLDASKADKLRYKRDGDVAKIFITPYKTSITEEDLTFSQGDVNVDAVVALGVDQREHLDQAIVTHGRILHDATVMTLMAGSGQSNIGSINWQDTNASSLSEMVVSISEAFQSGLIDAQIATSFLTGIVAETERFKNKKTTPKVMTMAAQLMSAGANQQLIADNLARPKPEPEPEMILPEEEPAAPEPSVDNNTQPGKETPFKNQQPEEKKDASSDALAFNMHDLEGDVQYGSDTSQSEDDGIEIDMRANPIDIDQEGNLQAIEEPEPPEASPQAETPEPLAGDSDIPAEHADEPFKNDQIASTGTLAMNENDAPANQEETADKKTKTAEGGESYTLKKGMKVIQPLPPESQAATPDFLEETPERTLDDIESRLARDNNAEQAVIESATPPLSPLTQDEARQHVEEAIKSDADAPPEPIEALNAQPLEEEQTSSPSASVQSTAPPLPPPPVDPSADGVNISLPRPE